VTQTNLLRFRPSFDPLLQNNYGTVKVPRRSTSQLNPILAKNRTTLLAASRFKQRNGSVDMESQQPGAMTFDSVMSNKLELTDTPNLPFARLSRGGTSMDPALLPKKEVPRIPTGY